MGFINMVIKYQKHHAIDGKGKIVTKGGEYCTFDQVAPVLEKI